MIWTAQDVEATISCVPDEFYKTIETWELYIRRFISDLKTYANARYMDVRKLPTRKDQAKVLMEGCSYPWLVFWLLDNKDIWPLLLKAATPKKILLTDNWIDNGYEDFFPEVTSLKLKVDSSEGAGKEKT